MRKLGAVMATAGLIMALSVGLTACGSSSDESDAQAKGGAITISQSAQPDFLDPALSYLLNGWEPMWLVYTPLITYRHEEGEAGAELIPGLAAEMPKVSNGGKTYELTLREGLKYSDGTPVRAADFEHTIKRVLNLESGGSPYFQVIDGATEYLEGGNAEADIPGIESNDKSGEITIELTEPDASFTNVLATNFAGIVPSTTPFRNMTKDPAPGAGAYHFTKSVPNREFVMEQNPHFDSEKIPDIPAGSIETITTKIVPSLTRQTQDVIDNKLDFMQDPPAADLKAEVIERFGPEGSEEQRYDEHPTLSTYFFFMNSRIEPFDDPKVREAVNIGLDKRALARVYSGELAPGCSFLPPNMAGYTEAIDISECPWGDPNEEPDLERAQELIKEAGAEGAEVTVWGNNEETSSKATQAYTDQLNQMGLDAEPKILGGSVYFATIGNEKTGAQTGFSNWFADFPHPLTFTAPVDGTGIQPTNNINFSYTDEPKINEEIAELRKEPEIGAVTDRWQALNDYIVEGSFNAPYGHRKLSTFTSDRIDFENCAVFHPVFQTDYSRFCLKSGE